MSSPLPTRRPPARRRVRALVCSLLAAVLGLTATACGSSSDVAADGTVTIDLTMWDTVGTPGLPQMQHQIALFEQAYPKIRINLLTIPFANFEQKMLLQIRGGVAPDVMQTSGQFTADFTAAGALADLTPLAGQSYIDQMSPLIARTATVDGKLVAAPWAIQPVGLWYDRTLMKQAGLDPSKPPTTVEELLADLRVIKKKLPGVIPMGIDSTDRVFGLDVNWPWIRSFGAQPFDADGKSDADTAQMADYLNFMSTLGHEGLTETNQLIGYFRPLVAQGKVAVIEDQSILESVVLQTQSAKMTQTAFNERYGATTLPSATDGPFSVAQDHQLAILKNSKHKQQAWDFVKWMTRSEAADVHVIKDKSAFPAATSLPASAEKLLEADPALQVFRDRIEKVAVLPPWGVSYGKAYDPIMIGVAQVMTSSKSASSVLRQMQSSLEVLLA